MSYTKGEFVHAALNEIGLADYDFDIGAEQTESAMRRLDAMMGEWESRGLKLSYPMPQGANGSSLDQDSNVPDVAWEAVMTNLALRIAPSYGKQVSPDTKIIAKNALNTLFSRYAAAPEMQLGQMPKGAGYKSEYAFSRPAIDTLKDGDTAELDLQGVFNGEYN